MTRNASCTRCLLSRGAKTVCLWGDQGSGLPNRIMLVGEAPGENEDNLGVPFVGAAGKKLDQALLDAGMSRSDVYITNATKCCPPQNRTPTPEESSACLPYLLEEIEQQKPRVIMCLGASALQLMTGQTHVGKARGRVIPPRKGLRIDVPIMATYHPAASLHAQNATYPALVEDLRRIGHRGASGTDSRLFPPPVGSYDEDRTRARCVALHDLRRASWLSCDLEWSAGADGMRWPWTPESEAFSIALSGRVDGAIVSVAFGLPQEDLVIEELRALLMRVGSVFHNSIADGLWLRHLDISIKLIGDTMLMQHAINETEPRSLESIALTYGGADPSWKMRARTLRQVKPTSEADWLDLLRYNVADTEATLRSMEGMIAHVKSLGPERAKQISTLHAKLMVPSIEPLVEMTYVGIPINEERLHAETDASKLRFVSAATELAGITGVTLQQAVKLANSSDQTKAYIKGTYGIDLDSATQLDLAKLKEYPAVPLIGRVRKETKRASTYFVPWSRLLARQGDGRLHSIYKPTGARTGRLSAEIEGTGNGAPINVAPRDDPDVKFRELVEAPPGYLLLSCDYSQEELRLISWLAPEPTMRHLYDSGADLHRALAAFFIAMQEHHGITIAEFMQDRSAFEVRIIKSERDKAKGVNFGCCYTMQGKKMKDVLKRDYGIDVTLQEAEEMVRGYMRLYSGVPIWHARITASVARLGYHDTIFGRRRHFDDPNEFNAAINFDIQSPASDIMLLSMRQAFDRLKEEHVRTQFVGEIHDSIIQLVHEDDIDKAKTITKYCMENVDTSAFGFKIPITLPVDASVSKRWGEDK